MGTRKLRKVKFFINQMLNNISFLLIQLLFLWRVLPDLSLNLNNGNCRLFGNAQDLSVETASLFLACTSPRGEDPIDDVKEAISNGADVNAVNPSGGGQTPFMAAVLRGKIKIVTYLLDNKDSLNLDMMKGEQQGYIPVDGAAFQGRADIMKLLIERGDMYPFYFHDDRFTPFHRACWGREERHAEVIQLLLEKGVNKDLRSRDGKTCREMTENGKTIALLDEWVDEF